MAFRKRNVTVGRSSSNASPATHQLPESAAPGVRPSPLTSHAVTSTGAPSLDSLLGGHAGLALGSSLLVEESGSTDFSGALLRYFAAEGICQGHVVHIVGAGEQWVRELPGVSDDKGREKKTKTADEEKMKIAWRYERLGQAGERGALRVSEVHKARKTILHILCCLLFQLPADGKYSSPWSRRNHSNRRRSSSGSSAILPHFRSHQASRRADRCKSQSHSHLSIYNIRQHLPVDISESGCLLAQYNPQTSHAIYTQSSTIPTKRRPTRTTTRLLPFLEITTTATQRPFSCDDHSPARAIPTKHSTRAVGRNPMRWRT